MNNSGMLNFQQLPKVANDPSNNVSPGRHRLTIKTSVVELTAARKKALIITNIVTGRTKPEIRDWYVCFSATGENEHFGQYKLGKLLEALNIVPQGDFSLEVLPTLINDKEYYGVLIEEKGTDNKMYLKIAHPDAEGNFEAIESVAVKEPITTGKPVSEEVKVEVEKDNLL